MSAADATGAVWPDGLRAAFDAYEAALRNDDVAALDDAFLPGPGTLRGDGAGLLVGHERISAFRARRGGIAPRTIGRVEIRPLTPDDVLTVAESVFAGGGRGLQTQLWRREHGGTWRIAAAHVTGRPHAFDRSVWRIVGDPLVRGARQGPLARKRVAVKDLFAVAGHAIGAGNPSWELDAPVEHEHAAAVQSLLEAGADLLGIARTDEFAYSLAGDNAHTGAPPNGADPARIPGGSTSGPASAVAQGFADIALGTDTAGSIRVPASYQGLWGIRTTHGAISRAGLLPLAQSFDTVGWLAREPQTLRAAAASAGLHSRAADGAAPRFAVCDALLAAASPDTGAAFQAWVAEAGVDAEPVDLPPLGELADTLRTIQAVEAWRNHGRWVRQHREAIGADVLARFDAAAALPPELEAPARERHAALRDAVRRALGDRVLLLPAVPGPAPLRSDAASVDAVRQATLLMTGVAGIGGLPQLVAPLLHVDGAPVGLSLIGRPGSELDLLDLAAELATPSPRKA